MVNHAWIDELNRLMVRFSVVGMARDTHSMSESELWGLYCGLRRLLAGRPSAGFIEAGGDR